MMCDSYISNIKILEILKICNADVRARQRCHLSICSYVGSIDKYSICQFNQYCNITTNIETAVLSSMRPYLPSEPLLIFLANNMDYDKDKCLLLLLVMLCWRRFNQRRHKSGKVVICADLKFVATVATGGRVKFFVSCVNFSRKQCSC